MQINLLKGDALESKDQFFVHQVNCMGIMGGGIAAQLKVRYPSVFEVYKNFLESLPDKHQALGRIAIARGDGGKVFFNLFGQDGIDYKESPFPDGRLTDYDAFRLGMQQIKGFINILVHNGYLKGNEVAITMPYNIGCGLAKGDWNIVLQIISDTFEDTDFNINFYKL